MAKQLDPEGEWSVPNDAPLRRVIFNEYGPPIDGAVTRRGYYETDKKFELNAAARLEDEPALLAFLEDFTISLQARRVDSSSVQASQGSAEPDDGTDLAAALREAVEAAEAEAAREGLPEREAAIAFDLVLLGEEHSVEIFKVSAVVQ